MAAKIDYVDLLPSDGAESQRGDGQPVGGIQEDRPRQGSELRPGQMSTSRCFH